MSKKAIGARLRRKEDDRFLHGRGQYIGDIRFPRMRDVAFVRSTVAHARLTGVRIPDPLRDCVFTAHAAVVSGSARGVLSKRGLGSLAGSAEDAADCRPG